MQGHQLIALTLSVVLVGGCRSERPLPEPTLLPTPDNSVEGTVVGDDRTAMEAAIDSGAGSLPVPAAELAPGAPALAPNAPESYVVKRGDTLWGIAKVFLRDPWFWPEIWQVNSQIQNPHLIYPGDTLRLVYIDGQPRVTLQRGIMERGDSARVLPRVRSQPLEAAVTTIPYEAVAAFMARPSVLSNEQVKTAPYVFANRDSHIVLSNGDTLYARGFSGPVGLGARYNIVRVGEALRDPDDDHIVGYDGIFTGAGHVTRSGDPATLVMTESTRETVPGDKLFAGGSDVALDFIPSAPKVKIDGSIMAVRDGVTVIGQYQVVVINRGARDGLAPGNVLAVFELGGTVRDTVKTGFLNGLSGPLAKRVRLPDERTGTFMVFKTFDRISYGLIMEAKNIVRVADRVGNP
ncbi:MAG: LysM peptidoglycan-binding domain-containing protein [Pseudomonadota bacterium]|nr:LysM peptidoglycan-binding domain-containing protein [Pseudomonadota bacterium]